MAQPFQAYQHERRAPDFFLPAKEAFLRNVLQLMPFYQLHGVKRWYLSSLESLQPLELVRVEAPVLVGKFRYWEVNATPPELATLIQHLQPRAKDPRALIVTVRSPVPCDLVLRDRKGFWLAKARAFVAEENHTNVATATFYFNATEGPLLTACYRSLQHSGLGRGVDRLRATTLCPLWHVAMCHLKRLVRSRFSVCAQLPRHVGRRGCVFDLPLSKVTIRLHTMGPGQKSVRQAQRVLQRVKPVVFNLCQRQHVVWESLAMALVVALLHRYEEWDPSKQGPMAAAGLMVNLPVDPIPAASLGGWLLRRGLDLEARGVAAEKLALARWSPHKTAFFL